jgi:predicted aconitase with swiveling domain
MGVVQDRPRKGKAQGVVLRNPDPVFVTALLVMEIPSVFVSRESFFDSVNDGQQIVLDSESGRGNSHR